MVVSTDNMAPMFVGNLGTTKAYVHIDRSSMEDSKLQQITEKMGNEVKALVGHDELAGCDPRSVHYNRVFTQGQWQKKPGFSFGKAKEWVPKDEMVLKREFKRESGKDTASLDVFLDLYSDDVLVNRYAKNPNFTCKLEPIKEDKKMNEIAEEIRKHPKDWIVLI